MELKKFFKKNLPFLALGLVGVSIAISFVFGIIYPKQEIITFGTGYKISELTALSETPASNDVFAIVDTSASATKKITFTHLVTNPVSSYLAATTTDALTQGSTNKYLGALSASYPLQFSSPALSLAFGTTTANTWSALNNFTNATTSLLTVSSRLWLGTATTTGTNGIDISGGCFAIGGTCLSTGAYTATYPITLTGSAFGIAFSTTTANTWSALNTFANATSSLLTFTTAWGTTLNTNSISFTTGSGNLTGNVTGNLTGNADTATNLANNPADCSANQYANAIAASGALTCSAITDADVPDTITVSNYLSLASWFATTTIPHIDTIGRANATTTFGGGLNAGGSSGLYVLQNGNVGIGTTGPSVPLHIAQSTGDGIRVTRTGGASLELTAFASETRVGSYTNYPLRLLVNNSERVTIDTSGNVGIGTTPYSKLSVWGSGTTTGQTFELVNNASTTLLKMLDNGTLTFGVSTATTTISSGVSILSALETYTNKVIKLLSGAILDLTGGTVKEYDDFSFTYASSTPLTATTTREIGVAAQPQQWTSAECYTDTGTVNISFYDGTNRMNMIAASTTPAKFALSTNNAFTSEETRKVDIGTPTSSPNRVSCTIILIKNP